METKTGSALLAALALAACCALAPGVAGCGKHASTREPAPPPSLADRLGAMTPQAQLDTLRVLTAAQPADARLAFHTGNAWYALAMEVPPEHGAEATAYLDSATTQYLRAITIDPDYSRAFVNMGLAYDAGRKSNEARSAFKRAIAIDPDDVLAYCHLGFLEYTAGNRSEAMDLYQRALQVDPGSPQAHYNLGLAFAEAKIFVEALVEWEQVAKLDPDGELGRTAAENVRIIRQYLAETP
ncbi:MAG: tetratricopeptide repeat protein [Candidatus Krumholzibacteria bacterium]|nr:tetratricopeptide repeat protein [Candidatus Krumholzibacteria bacterium]MDH4335895.1 tetratricopeptide repeat protein [Candidatus Krumholzibacteria bacterium]MDH5268529.1 tetratricopeptide repeat protein [Candidatus Krumholzibacteria bacterium]